MDATPAIFSPGEISELISATAVLREGRGHILQDWVNRVRDNQALRSEAALPDPLLLDHLPHLFDAILDRLEVNRPRDDAEQLAEIHGFMRRVDGYDVAETVAELLMFRRAIWAHLTAVEAPIAAGYAAMEQIDGMVDRAVLSSLGAFLNPRAALLERTLEGAGT